MDYQILPIAIKAPQVVNAVVEMEGSIPFTRSKFNPTPSNHRELDACSKCQSENKSENNDTYSHEVNGPE